MKVYGVWIGKYEADLAYLFSTREAAEQYANDYNHWDVTIMNEHLRKESKDMGTPLREWEPQAFVVEHTVYESGRDADARLYEMIARDIPNG